MPLFLTLTSLRTVAGLALTTCAHSGRSHTKVRTVAGLAALALVRAVARATYAHGGRSAVLRYAQWPAGQPDQVLPAWLGGT